jgi:hypothetical protein
MELIYQRIKANKYYIINKNNIFPYPTYKKTKTKLYKIIKINIL